jgi:WD40 repeat protein
MRFFHSVLIPLAIAALSTRPVAAGDGTDRAPTQVLRSAEESPGNQPVFRWRKKCRLGVASSWQSADINGPVPSPVKQQVRPAGRATVDMFSYADGQEARPPFHQSHCWHYGRTVRFGPDGDYVLVGFSDGDTALLTRSGEKAAIFPAPMKGKMKNLKIVPPVLIFPPVVSVRRVAGQPLCISAYQGLNASPTVFNSVDWWFPTYVLWDLSGKQKHVVANYHLSVFSFDTLSRADPLSQRVASHFALLRSSVVSAGPEFRLDDHVSADGTPIPQVDCLDVRSVPANDSVLRHEFEPRKLTMSVDVDPRGRFCVVAVRDMFAGTKKILSQIEGRRPGAPFVTADLKRIKPYSGENVMVVDLASRRVTRFDVGQALVQEVHVSADGKRCLSVAAEGTAAVLDIERKEVVGRFWIGLRNAQVAFSESAGILAVGDDREVCLFNVSTGQVLQQYSLADTKLVPVAKDVPEWTAQQNTFPTMLGMVDKKDLHQISDISLSPDGAQLAVLYYDGLLEVWPVRVGAVERDRSERR